VTDYILYRYKVQTVVLASTRDGGRWGTSVAVCRALERATLHASQCVDRHGRVGVNARRHLVVFTPPTTTGYSASSPRNAEQRSRPRAACENEIRSTPGTRPAQHGCCCRWKDCWTTAVPAHRTSTSTSPATASVHSASVSSRTSTAAATLPAGTSVTPWYHSGMTRTTMRTQLSKEKFRWCKYVFIHHDQRMSQTIQQTGKKAVKKEAYLIQYDRPVTYRSGIRIIWTKSTYKRNIVVTSRDFLVNLLGSSKPKHVLLDVWWGQDDAAAEDADTEPVWWRVDQLDGSMSMLSSRCIRRLNRLTGNDQTRTHQGKYNFLYTLFCLSFIRRSNDNKFTRNFWWGGNFWCSANSYTRISFPWSSLVVIACRACQLFHIGF